MAKIPTTWANNDVQAQTPWTAPAKNNSQWANNDVKNPTQYVSANKSIDRWNPNTPANQNYQYDNADMTYDSNLWFYNSLVNNNTDNQRLVTKWSKAI